MAKVHRIVLMIVDHEEISDKDVQTLIEQADFLNPSVLAHTVVELPDEEWDDDHLLNKLSTTLKQFDDWMKNHNPTTLL